MKHLKIAFVGMMMAAAQSAMADYDYLNVVTTADATTSLPVSGLKLTYSDGKLVATSNGSVVYTEELTALSYMYFGNTNGVKEIQDDSNATVEVYTTGGHKVKTLESGKADLSGLPAGAYIIKQGVTTRKIVIK